MEHLNSELINKYIDNELDESEIAFVHKHLQECQTFQNEITLTKKIIEHLHKSLVYPSDNFSKTLMSKIVMPTKNKFKIKNFFSFENNIIIVSVIFFLGILVSIGLTEDNPSQAIKEHSIISNFTSIFSIFASDISNKINNSLTKIFEKESFTYIVLGTFSILFFLIVDQLIIFYNNKRKKSYTANKNM